MKTGTIDTALNGFEIAMVSIALICILVTLYYVLKLKMLKRETLAEKIRRTAVPTPSFAEERAAALVASFNANGRVSFSMDYSSEDDGPVAREFINMRAVDNMHADPKARELIRANKLIIGAVNGVVYVTTTDNLRQAWGIPRKTTQ